MPFPPPLTGLWGVSSNTLLTNKKRLWNGYRWPTALCTINSAADEVVFYGVSLSTARHGNPAGWWMWAQFLYSRGKCTDVFVPTERQADCSKGSTLVEHLCYLRGQIACWGHQHFSKVTCPGCRLFLRSTSQKKKVTDFAFTLERKASKHFETSFYF